MPSNFNFFALPAELRRIIYKHLLEDTHIRLDSEKLLIAGTESGPKIFKELLLNEMIDFVIPEDQEKITLLRTFAIYHREAITILAANSTIEVPVKVIGKKIYNIFALIDPDFLRFVPTVQISPDFLLHFRSMLLPLLPRLKHLILTGHTRAPDQTIAFTIYDLHCTRCGDHQGKKYFEHFWRSLRSGLLKRSHIRQLAREKGWTMDLIVTFDRFRHVPGNSTKHKDFTIRFHWNMAGPRLISKDLLKSGEVVLPGENFSTASMLQALDTIL